MLVASSSQVIAEASGPAPVYDGLVASEVYVPTRYGTEINIDLCLPATAAGDAEPAAGPFPVVAEMNYLSTPGTVSCDDLRARTFCAAWAHLRHRLPSRHR